MDYPSGTPGPYVVWKNYDAEGFISEIGIDTLDRSVGIATILTENVTFEDKERFNAHVEADAALFAVAPEMFRLLRKAQNWIEMHGPTDAPDYSRICLGIAEIRRKIGNHVCREM